jgi:uncharacterized membrane protein
MHQQRPGRLPSDAIDRNVGLVARLEAAQIEGRTPAERIAGVVTRAAGTATFAVLHAVWFVVWIVVNAGAIRRVRPFDPFPFNLLTMIVSLEAIFLSIWILISQNQLSRQADRREQLDLQVNLLAEQESTATLRLVTRIAARLGIDTAREAVDESLTAETDLEQLASAVGETLPEPPAASSRLPPPTQS